MAQYEPFHLDATYHDLASEAGRDVYFIECFGLNRAEGIRFAEREFAKNEFVKIRLNAARKKLRSAIPKSAFSRLLDENQSIGHFLTLLSSFVDAKHDHSVRVAAYAASVEVYDLIGVALISELFELPDGAPPKRPKRQSSIQLPMG